MSTSPPSPNFPRETVTGLPGWLILLGALNAIGPLSIDMYLPGLPQIAIDLHTDAGGVQRTLALFFVGLAFGQLVYGPFSDRFGRKPPLYVGLGVYTLASLGCAFASDVHTLTIWRFAQAMGGCAGMLIPRAVVRDRCDPLGMARALSMLMLVIGLAPILAPLLGTGVMALFGWRAVFLVLAAFGAVCLLAVMFGMRETHDASQAQSLHIGHVLRTYAALLRDGGFMRPALTAALAQGGMFAYIAGSSFVFIELYGLSPQAFSWIFGANAFGLIGASQINARLVRRVPLRKVIRVALLGAGTASVSLLLANFAGVLSLPVILVGLFAFLGLTGFVGPNTAALALQHQGHRAGMASALLGCIQFGMGTAAGLVISVWQRPDALPLLGVMMACGCGALLVVSTAPRTQATA